MNKKKQKPRDAGIEVLVTGSKLIISVGIETLKFAFENSEYCQPYDDDVGEYRQTLVVTDSRDFAEDVKQALLKEDPDDGTTPVHLLLDKACEEAVEQGSENVMDPVDMDTED